MKKLAVICFFIAIAMPHIFAQNNALYDANYDEPEKTAIYDDSLNAFQKIYLQYEDAITTAGNIIRQEEKAVYLKELENFKAEERARTNTTIEKMRQSIYGNEVESVRQQETERLTTELTEKISAELNQELSAKYEKIKNDEIAELYADLKKKAYNETEATTQRVKSISSASAQVIIIVLILAIIIIGIQKIIDRHRQKVAEKDRFDSIVEEYIIRLKAYNGEPYHITVEINKVYGQKDKEKSFHMKALAEAENRYSGDLKELQEYKDEFDTYASKFRNYFNAWKEDNYQQISGYLKCIYGDYKKTGQELYKSFEFRTDADKKNAKARLDIISKELEDFSKDIKRKDVDAKDKEYKELLSKDFADLSTSFKKGEF